ncbi:hypothetical protein ABZS52_18410 [Micromonospora profundi]|uniref:hypothetical protein n=1 Tax=Micromonospora profundi TaxID=1420889 RepID=UPI0033B21CE9
MTAARASSRHPRKLQIHPSVDNYSTHTHPNVKARLTKHPRFYLCFSPTGSSLLNMVGRWFATLTEDALRRGVFRGVDDLVKAIDEHLRAHHDDPRPIV